MSRYGRPVKIVTADQRAGRPRVRVSGAVRRVRASGPAGLPMLRAELGGDADRITVIWLGMLSQLGGRRIMYNPRYDLGTDAAGGPVPGP